MKKQKYIFIPLLLLALFLGYQVSITMFSHVHYVNGVMIVHSHPSADDMHTHTEGQIVTMAQVSSFLGTEPVFMWIDDADLPVCGILEYKRDFRQLPARCISGISLRAPPFC